MRAVAEPRRGTVDVDLDEPVPATPQSASVPPQLRRSLCPRERSLAQVDIDGVAFDAMTEQQVVEHVVASLADGRGGMLLTPNVDILRQLRRPSLMPIADQADLVVADGMPIVWASRLLGRPLPERVTGASLAHSLPAAAAREGRSVFLLGGEDGVAEKAAERLTSEVEGLTVAGWHCPPHGFERDGDRMREMVDALSAAAPDVVLVGLGFPKQERLIGVLRNTLPAAWFIGCGGALTFLSGEVARAPKVMQRSGLEWTHRLAMEPRRMARRYLVDDLPYAAAMFARVAKRAVAAA
ncbi:N-acetylglucosaminyldiphosphoundecaprenol N-acetyl-beta-D-mannosaminyltransferase [Pseudokineococcus lusitanus]|uniref:N-acetylglucosaminyldiphosphoundecaprenol N-acetyl-beta-D-mannosaminyltransferase n=1 Tax=Pseudokineococcus lusitanus TaxID=763993 RepID=A0A3N1G934_9ACTN|nr:N-acetylglucosaminyldiphosphoundecaprenol N-acetyl-beta-D-mannosaminyltransferase [Pseudokineococcus lusitanus]